MSEQRGTIPLNRAAVNDAPATNGVYIFRSAKGIQYIGKSVNLKARLLSHLENAKIDPKEAAIIHHSMEIEYIITDSEFKALLLESRLIQEHKPLYNRRWMDDKSYLYIKITMKDDYPKIYQVRREFDNKSLYFGPFPSTKIVQEILREIRRVFPFCTQKRIYKTPCFYSKIGQCNPCPNKIEQLKVVNRHAYSLQKKQYRHNIRQIVKVLEGNTDLILKSLYDQIKQYTEEEKYEEALVLRNKVKRLEYFMHERLFSSSDTPNYNQAEDAVISLQQLLQPYLFTPRVSKPDGDTRGVSLRRIECYDISNSSQKDATASMVVISDGIIDKSQYRRFKIKDLKLQSDFEMMSEIFRRRFRTQNSNVKTQNGKKMWPMPELIVVDGGKPQVRIIKKVLKELQIDIPLIGIAKHPDRLVIGKDNLITIKPSYNHLGFNLIRSLRDESHRFAKKYHVLLRDKKLML